MAGKTMDTAKHFDGCDGTPPLSYIEERCECGVRISRAATEELTHLRTSAALLARIRAECGPLVERFTKANKLCAAYAHASPVTWSMRDDERRVAADDLARDLAAILKGG